MPDPESIAAALGQEPPPSQGQEPVQPEPVSDPGQGPESGGETAEERQKRANREAKNLRTRLRETEAKLAETEQSKMTDSERLQALEKQVADERVARLKAEVGIQKGLPAKMLKYLQGSTQEELEESADELKSMMGKAEEPTSDFGAGARPPANGDSDADFNATLRRAARR